MKKKKKNDFCPDGMLTVTMPPMLMLSAVGTAVAAAAANANASEAAARFVDANLIDLIVIVSL